jgi:large subunit ribosomal protein L15
MVTNIRKKNSRQKGTHTHGWGSKKKHRGAGNRGGRGLAGSGKRCGANAPTHWKERYFGKHGFKKKGQKINFITFNVGDIEKLSKTEINLSDLKFNKLLGNGKINTKVKITVDYASKKAIEKVTAAGGEIILNKEESKG